MNFQQLALIRMKLLEDAGYPSGSRYSLRGTFRGTLPGEPGSRYRFRDIVNPIFSEGIQNPLLQSDALYDSPYYDDTSVPYYVDDPGDYQFKDYSDCPVVYVDHEGRKVQVRAVKTHNGYIYLLDEPRAESPSEPIPQPPINAEYILHLLLNRNEQEAVIGDLLELYPKKVERLGECRARFWFYAEVIRSIWPLIRRAIARASGLIALGEWIRRYIS